MEYVQNAILKVEECYEILHFTCENLQIRTQERQNFSVFSFMHSSPVFYLGRRANKIHVHIIWKGLKKQNCTLMDVFTHIHINPADSRKHRAQVTEENKLTSCRHQLPLNVFFFFFVGID